MKSPDVSKLELERVNVLLSVEDSRWLDTLASEVRSSGGAKISRSQIVRSALAVLRELHKELQLHPITNSGPSIIGGCKSGNDLAVVGMIAVRHGVEAWATQLHTPRGSG